MSAKRNQNFQETSEIIEEFEDAVVVETPIVEPPAEPIDGVVSGCELLNLRQKPHGTIVCRMPVDTKVLIDPDNSNDEWLHVYTETGAEGYCMKQYITTV